MTKRKIPERARDRKTLADKVAFSLMVREKWEALADDPWSCPSDIHAIIDKYDDEKCPWSKPDWAEQWAHKERAKRAIERLVRDAE
jgi:hypothetical protein